MKTTKPNAPLTEPAAVTIARECLRKHCDPARFSPDSPRVSIEDGAFMIEFAMHPPGARPGVCIIAVDRTTGAARVVPVE